MKTALKNIMTLLSAGMLALAGTAMGATYSVPGDFGTIQEAINAAPDNSVINVGAGVYNEKLVISDKSFLSIRAVAGAGSTVIDGGGIASVATVASALTGSAGITIDGFTLRNGYSAADGGGVRVLGTARVTVLNSHVVNNSASFGGAFSVSGTGSLTVYNSVVDNNAALYEGGAFYLGSGYLILGNNTVTRNIAPAGGSIKQLSGAAVSGKNEIMYGNLDGNGDPSLPVFFDPSTVSFSNSDIELTVTGTANINADPKFVDALTGNYQLSAGSPAVDAGEAFLPADILGVVRPQGPATDMGAYEYVNTDTTAPAVASTNPANGATNAPVSNVIAVTFSEDIVAGGAINNIRRDSMYQFTAAISGNTLTLTVKSCCPSIAAGKTYKITIPAGAVKDAAGNAMAAYSFSFSTAAPADTTPPTVVGTNPANGAINVDPVTTSFTLNLNEKIVAGSAINYITVNGQTLTASITGSAAATLALSGASLSPGTSYTVSIPAGAVTDAAGNAMAAYSFSFSTAAPADTTPPTVVSTSPANGARHVSLSSAITITFSENVSAGAAFTGISLKKGRHAVNISTSLSGNSLTIIPERSLREEKTYSVTIPASAVEDAAGNAIEAAYSIFFTTR